MEGSNMVLFKCLLYGEEGPNLKVGQQWRKLDQVDGKIMVILILRVKDEKGVYMIC